MTWLKPVDEGRFDDRVEADLLALWHTERTERTLRTRFLEMSKEIESSIINQVVSQLLPFVQDGISTETVRVFAWTEITRWFTFLQQRALVRRMAEEGVRSSWNPAIVAALVSEFFQFALEGGQTFLHRVVQRVDAVLQKAHEEAGCTA